MTITLGVFFIILCFHQFLHQTSIALKNYMHTHGLPRWPPSMQETPMEEAVATHSSILTWRIPWTEEPGRLQSIGLQRVRHDWSNSACVHAIYTHIYTVDPWATQIWTVWLHLYMDFFFFYKVCTIVLHNPRLVEFTNVELWSQGLIKIICRLLTVLKVGVPNPHIVPGSTVYLAA